MDYTRQLEAFYSNINFNPISANAMTVYQAILFIAYTAKRFEDLSIANTRLVGMCNLTLKQLQSARNELIVKKYITYKKGRNQNEAPKYLIPILYEDNSNKKGQPEVIAEVMTQGRAAGKAEVMAQGNINNTTLHLFLNYINDSSKDFFEDGKRTVNLQDKALIIINLKRLGIFIDNLEIVNLFTEQKFLEVQIFYWIIKEIYFSAYKGYLKDLSYNTLCLKYLKAKQYTNAEKNFDTERIISYVIKSLQDEFKNMKK